MPTPSAHYWIDHYHMQPHPEGGWFAETYRSAERIDHQALPSRFGGNRPFGTAILFLIESPGFSALHRIKADEIWHFYAGQPLEIVCITPEGDLQTIQLGTNAEAGERLQAMVPFGDWFGARLANSEGYALVGCTVAPGFDFEDFELAERASLSAQFPQHRAIIEAMTR